MSAAPSRAAWVCPPRLSPLEWCRFERKGVNVYRIVGNFCKVNFSQIRIFTEYFLQMAVFTLCEGRRCIILWSKIFMDQG